MVWSASHQKKMKMGPCHFDLNMTVDNYGVLKEEFGEEFFTLIGDILVDIIELRMRKCMMKRKKNQPRFLERSVPP